MPGDLDGLQQTPLWRLEDDFEGVSTPSTAASPVVAQPAASDRKAGDERNGQPEGTIDFDGRERYTYSGCVLEGGRYVRKTMTFTCAEAGVYPTEPPWRVCAMLDLVGRSPQRQAEIGRFGQRVWHSPYRPEGAALQGLDYIFRHDVDLVAACHPAAAPFYAAEREQADRWTRAMADAYQVFVQQRDGAALLRLLAAADIPPAAIGLDSAHGGGDVTC